MELGLLLLLTIFMIFWMSWLRGIYFCRQPKFDKMYNPNELKSPAEGNIVYINTGLISDLMITKDAHPISIFDVPVNDTYNYISTEFTQIGIFMTQYDNHHFINSVNSRLITKGKMRDTNPSSMMSLLDMSLSIFGIKFFDWARRSLSFLCFNEQYYFIYENGIIIVVTMDKFVNKFDIDIKDTDLRYDLGFIHRGSQTDVFIPSRLIHSIQIEVGQRVSYNITLLKGIINES